MKSRADESRASNHGRYARAAGKRKTENGKPMEQSRPLSAFGLRLLFGPLSLKLFAWESCVERKSLVANDLGERVRVRWPAILALESQRCAD